MRGVVSAIQANLALEPSEFVLRLVGKQYEAYYVPYGFYFTHDFRFDSSAGSEQCTLALRAQLDTVLQKYHHLAEKTLNVLKGNKRVLLVSCGNSTQADVDDLCRLLESKFASLQYTILHMPWTNRGHALINHPNVLCVPGNYVDWPGDELSWDSAFSGIEVREFV